MCLLLSKLFCTIEVLFYFKFSLKTSSEGMELAQGTWDYVLVVVVSKVLCMLIQGIISEVK